MNGIYDWKHSHEWSYLPCFGIVANGEIDCYKAHMVTTCFSQIERIDYIETFAPVARYSLIHMLLWIIVMLDLEIHWIDVKTTFFHCELKEDVYMVHPKGYEKPNCKEFCANSKRQYMDCGKHCGFGTRR
jgi:hypothetical protein